MKRDTLLLMSSFAQFALFIPVTVWAAQHKNPPPAEIALTRLLQKKQSSRLRHTVQVVNTSLCSSAASNLLVIPITVFLWKRQRQSDALATLATHWLGQLLQRGLKRGVSRPRPSPVFVHITKPRNRRSFPSGDVISTVSLWGWLFGLTLLSKEPHTSARIVPLSIPALLLAFVGPARIYMGDHWASDVLGGYLFGGGWVCLSLYVYTKWGNLNTSSKQNG